MNRYVRVRRWLVYVAVTLSGAAFVAFILISPVVLQETLGGVSDWHNLSEIGQAYGGVSALLAGFAFCGITVSIALQWRQNHLMRLVSLRERHFELLRLALDRPELMWHRRADESAESHAKMLYLNLWVSYWSMGWDVGAIDRTSLRKHFATMFQDDTAIDWWGDRGGEWTAVSSRRTREFLDVAGRSYIAALSERKKRGVAGDNALDGRNQTG